MIANAGQMLRVVFGLTLPLLLALPTWWSLRAERAVLRETKALIEADLAPLATGATLGSESNRLRALLISRQAVVAAIDSERMGSLEWLGALGTLPAGVELTRAALTGAEWEIAGAAASNALVDALLAHLERAGFLAEGIETDDAEQPGVAFHMRGRAVRDTEGRGEP